MCNDCEPCKCFINTRNKIDRVNHDNNALCDKCGHLLNRHFDQYMINYYFFVNVKIIIFIFKLLIDNYYYFYYNYFFNYFFNYF